ncbi:MAG: ABC-F family ATP-binding cassette domain-containing protein, partial [Candidatus Sungbacteria bacterium]|nr:ABC-F family ATP-binding cassette domain-containing protein [Candidatus Sungbacteria bacterium]
IREKRAQAEVFAHKGGKMRGVAKRMREAAQEAEESLVDVRSEDKTIRAFTIPAQELGPDIGKVVHFRQVVSIKNGEPVVKKIDMTVSRRTHLLIAGPNGIGKSTLLEKLASRQGEGFSIEDEVKIGYYKQDFSNFDADQIAYQALAEVMAAKDDEGALRSAAAGFLLDGKLLAQPTGALSEGQKGLLSFCRLKLMKPGLLILDEPTNHINFRHLPIIAQALDEYEGALIMVSHIPSFVEQVRIDEVIDLESV